MFAVVILCGIFHVGFSQTGFNDRNSLSSRTDFPSTSQWTLETMPSQIVTSGFGSRSRIDDQFRTELPPQFSSISNRQRLQFQNPRSRQTNRNFMGQQQRIDLQRLFSSPDAWSTGFVTQNQRDSQVFVPSFWDTFSSPVTTVLPNQIDLFQTGAGTGMRGQIEMIQNPFVPQFNPFISNSLESTFINDQQMIRNGPPGQRNDSPPRQSSSGGPEGDVPPRWLSNIPQGMPSGLSLGNRNNDSAPEDTLVSRDGLNNPRNRSDVTNLSESFERFNRGSQDFRGPPNMLGNDGAMQFMGNPRAARENMFVLPPRMMGNRMFGGSANGFNTADNFLFSG